ncbi:MAG: hypothetical protein K8R90_06165 [Candidatus Cloacimonetes bacterium]|nr:hypothetical protein [Candidatus Cloacimonadota bacterium]
MRVYCLLFFTIAALSLAAQTPPHSTPAAAPSDSVDTSAADTAVDTLSSQQRQSVLLAIDRHLAAFENAYPHDAGTSLYEARAAWKAATEHGASYQLPATLLALGRAMLLTGDTLRAVQHLDDALQRYVTLDDLGGASATRRVLGELHLALADTARATTHLGQALEDSRRLNDSRGMMLAGAPLIELLLAQRMFTEALALLPDVRSAAHAAGNKPRATDLDLELARLQWLGGMQTTALATALQAVSYANNHGDLTSMHEAYTLLAQLEEQAGQPENALKHHRLAAELERTALQQSFILQLATRDSILHQRELRIESLEQLVADLHRSADEFDHEVQAARETAKELKTTQKSARQLLVSIRWLVLGTLLASAMAVMGWMRYARLRRGVLQECSSRSETTEEE